MLIFTYSLARVSINEAVSVLRRPPTPQQTPGLVHAEFMSQMELGSPIFSPSRVRLRQLTLFAAWKNHEAFENYLQTTELGQRIQDGWSVRLEFLRRWGRVKEIAELSEIASAIHPSAPVVAVTIARMKLPEVPRFLKWGRPVEKLVRDHPGATFATASMRLPRTVSTFSIWNNQKEMLNMVHGHSAIERPERHAIAMRERERKDFHFEFTTLRFKPIAEHGSWQGRSNMVPE